MDFEYDDEQKALRDAVKGLLTKTYGDWEVRRQTADKEPGYSSDLWGKLAEMGVLALPFSEDDGGVGAGVAELGIVAEEMGRVLAPEPVLTAVVLAGGAIAAAGSAEQKTALIEPLVAGESVLAFAHDEPSGSGVSATADGDAWTLTGTKDPVIFGGAADHLVVTAALPDGGTGLFVIAGDADGVSRTAYSTHEGGRAATVVLDGASAEPLGAGGDVTSSIEILVATAQVVAAHEAIGSMAKALELTTDYLTSRKQFGVTLNTFQALNFRAADMYVALELTRSVVLWAGMVLDAARATGDTSLVVEAATRASLQVSTGGRALTQEAIQLHGGIGVTAEYAVGHFLARLHAIEQTLGGRGTHLSTLAATVGDHGLVDPLP